VEHQLTYKLYIDQCGLSCFLPYISQLRRFYITAFAK